MFGLVQRCVLAKTQPGKICWADWPIAALLATIRRDPTGICVGEYGMKIIYPLIGCVSLALTVCADAAPLSDDFWLLGNFTQNVPCKGDGTDPPEIKVKVTTTEIDSKVGVCTFLDAKEDSKSLKAHVECQFPAGPLMGDITFTLKPNNTISFVDRDKTYTATLYRCPK